MKKYFLTLIETFFAISVILLIFNVIDSCADEIKDKKSPLEITSKSMIVEEKSNVITFNGSVVAKKDNITIFSDKMVVSHTVDKKIKNVLASGNVKLVQDTKEIRSENAEYLPDEEKVIFTGSPVFTENNNTVTGSMITYFIPSGKSIVENSRVILR